MLLIVYMLWTVSCVGCFLLGLYIKHSNGRSKSLPYKLTLKRAVKPTEKSAAEYQRQQQELRNFWSYDGTEQEPIKEPDSL